MKYRFLRVTNELIAMVENYILVTAVLACIYEACGNELTVATIFAFFGVPVIFYLQRKMIDSLLMFLFLHIAVPVGYSFAYGPKDIQFIIDILLILFFTVRSFVSRMKKSEAGEEMPHPIFAGVIFTIAILFLSYLVSDENLETVFFLIPIFAALYPIAMYIDRFVWFDFMNSKTVSNIPSDNILKTGFPYVILMSGVYIVTAYLCLDEELIARIGAFLSRVVRNIIRFLLSFIKSGELKEVKTTEEAFEQSIPDFSIIAEETETSAFALFMQKLFSYLAVFAVTVGIIAAVIALIRFIVKNFHGREKKPESISNNEYEEERETIKIKRREKTFFSFRQTPAEKIRKIYVKIAGNNRNLTDSPGLFSVREYAGLFSENKREAAFEYAKIYEKARYSDAVCTKEDYESAKKYAAVLLKRETE